MNSLRSILRNIKPVFKCMKSFFLLKKISINTKVTYAFTLPGTIIFTREKNYSKFAYTMSLESATNCGSAHKPREQSYNYIFY